MSGKGMIWPLANEYVLKGYSVRRAAWNDETVLGDTGTSLRWIYYFNSLYWLLYRATGTGLKTQRVVRNTDFTTDEFFAEDWTVLTPDCFEASVEPGENYLQQGKKRYPRPSDLSPLIDPSDPNGSFGACLVIPKLSDLRIYS